MKLNYDRQKNDWDFFLRDLLSHHDVVFQAPVCDPTYGIPIGDGDTGSLLWLSPDTLNININKTDLWDDSTSTKENDYVCATEEENITVNRSGALVKFQFGCPVFETIYQKHFEGRLCLANATATLTAQTPFCNTSISAFASHEEGVTVISLHTEFEEPMPFSVSMERYGSRSFWFWYSQYKDQPEKGLGGTSSSFDDCCMSILQQCNGRAFSIALLPVCNNSRIFARHGSHMVNCTFETRKEADYQFYLAIAVEKTAEAAKAAAIAKVKAAAEKGMERLYEEHCSAWDIFWNKSFISLPDSSDYVENLWYLNLYYANSEMRGAYPPHFCNGIWGFYHDFVPWNMFFHYNMQLSTFPLHTANHPELLDTYFRFRKKQLPYAETFAREVKKTNGAFYADVCDKDGRNEAGTRDNCTCGAQIAQMMYQHYLYTGDTAFLKETALPVMQAAGEFYLDKLKLAEDGSYHIYQTQGYEGSPLLDDSITDHAMIRALFQNLVKELPEAEAEPYRVRLEHLAPYHTLPMETNDEIKDGFFLRGLGKGNAIKGNLVLSVGKKQNEGWIRKTHGNPEKDYYGFPDTEMAPVFPSGLVGIRDRGSELYNMIYNSICIHHPTLPKDNQFGGDASDGMCMGWCLMPIYLARMGMEKELSEQLKQSISAWMVFPQGFGDYGPYENHGNFSLRWKKNTIRNTEKSTTTSSPAWNFRHFDYETLPILATAVNEMLLQSYDGVLRLFAAISENQTYAFRLAAEGGFLVNACYDNGDCDVFIYSSRGGMLSVQILSVNSMLSFFDETGDKLIPSIENGVYSIETSAGMTLRIATAHACQKGLSFERYYEKNMAVKTLGNSKLGTEREYGI